MDFQADFSFNTSLRDKVYDYLRLQIISGKLQPGTRLPEVELATSMNVSRAPIREALNMLCKDGLVTNIPRRGAIVSMVSGEDVKNNWEIRELLEPHAAKVACPLIPTEEIVLVREHLDAVMANLDDYDAYMRSDNEVHELVYDYLPNEQMQKILLSTMTRSMRFRYLAETTHPSKHSPMAAVTQEHIDLVDALLQRDEEKAYSAMLTHIQNGFLRIKDKF